MRRFVLDRKEDVSGVSGLGVVAEGIQFHDGQCAMSWLGRFHTMVIAPNIEELINIHGHDGRTVVVWLDNDDSGS